MGANTVDCSQELIDRNWSRIIAEHGAVAPLENSEIKAPETIAAEETRQEVIDTLQGWLSSGLNAVFNKLLELNIDVSIFDDWTQNTAELVQKYNVNMSSLEIIVKYRIEIAFVWSTLMLAKAISKGMKAKKARLNSEKTEKNTRVTIDATA